MSTRCQIIINKKNQIKGNKTIIYRHSDGYPDTENGVIAEIMPFLEKFSKERGLNDLEYLGARLLQYLTNKHDKVSGGYPEETYLGYGLCNQLHFDIEFFYIVTPTALYAYEINEVTDKLKADINLIETIKL